MSKRLLIFIFLYASFAFAEKEVINERYYIQGNLGYATGVAPGGNFEKNTFGNAGVYSLALGYRFDNNIRADWSLEYRNGFENKYYASFEDPNPDEETRSQDEDMSHISKVRSLSTFINVYYDLPKMDKVTPYVLIGAGMVRNVTQSHGWFYHSDGTIEKVGIKTGHKVSFAWKVGAGASYEFNKDIDLGLFYQYVDLGKIATGRAEQHPDGDVVGNIYEGRLKSHEFLANIKYKF